MRYLVTDPCYIVPDAEWDKFLEVTDMGDSLPEGGYNIDGFGRITDLSPTEWGDGRWRVGSGKYVTADAGLVCIAELEPDTIPGEYEGNAITKVRGVAEHWLSTVAGHECFPNGSRV